MGSHLKNDYGRNRYPKARQLFYLPLAIFTTLCCCLPIGIYAILRAMKVNDYYMMKQYDAAVAASNDAKKWSIIGIVLGVVGSILYFAFFGGLAMLGNL